MKALFSSTGAWWDGRSLRERRMLAVMGVVVLGVIAWLGVVRPLDGWKADQARARVAAERQMAQAQTAVAQRGARPTEAVDLQARVASAALTAGGQPTPGVAERGRLGLRPARVTAAQAVGGRAGRRSKNWALSKMPTGRWASAGRSLPAPSEFSISASVGCGLEQPGGAGITIMSLRLALPLITVAVLAGCASPPRVETVRSA